MGEFVSVVRQLTSYFCSASLSFTKVKGISDFVFISLQSRVLSGKLRELDWIKQVGICTQLFVVSHAAGLRELC